MASAIWTVCAALLVPLTVSDVTGQPLTARLSPSDIWSVASLVETAGAWRWTAFLAAIVTVASIPVLRWSPTPLLFAGSLVTLIPLALTGHSSSGGSHDLATNSLLIHLIAAALWAGGLLALLVHALRGGGHADLAARRFSAVALWCFVAMALSGIVNALVRIRPGELFDGGYGLSDHRQGRRAVHARRHRLASAAQRRRRTASRPGGPRPADQAGDDRGGGLRPDVRHRGRAEPDPAAAAAGLQPVHPRDRDRLRLRRARRRVARVLFDWRFDLVFGTAAIVMALVYLAGVRTAAAARRRVADGPDRGVAARLPGAVVRDVVGYRPVHAGDVQHAHGRAHAAVDADADPAGARRAGDAGAARAACRGKGEPPGPREWLLAALHSRVSRFLTNPIVATVLFVAGFYGLYFGGIFDAAVGTHAAHLAMNLHFLLTGYLFYWVVIGVDPTPRPIPPLGKVGMVFASLPLHAFFGVVLMSTNSVLGESFYKSLQLYWHTDLLGDQKLGGGIAWSAGEIPLVVVMIALLVQWTRSDRRTAKRLDRAADRDDDADLAAYNAMLAELAKRDAR